MRQFITLLKKEFMAYFLSYSAYFIVGFYIFLSMVSNFYLGGYFVSTGVDLTSFFYFQPQMLMTFIPLFAMRSWSEERKTGTFEVALSYPVSYYSLVLAKFLACFKISVLMILLTTPLWVYSNFIMILDNSAVFSGYVGCLMIAMVFCAISCFVSSTNSSSVVSYLLSVMLIWIVVSVNFDFLLSPFDFVSKSLYISTRGALSLTSHYNSFISGQIGIDSFIYMLSITVVFIILNKFSIEDRKKNKGLRIFIFVVSLSILAILVNLISSILFSSAKIDLTSDKKYTLSDSTVNILENLQEPIDITVYQSANVSKAAPELANYGKFIVNYLEKYRSVSKGLVSINVKVVERYSIEEKEAKDNKIMPFLADNGEDIIYFGAVLYSSKGKSQVIDILAPNRMKYFERDFSRAIYNLVNQDKKYIGYVNTLGNGVSDDIIISILSQTYEVYKISPYEVVIPDGIDALVVVNMQSSSGLLSYAIDQYLLEGKKMLAFVDNYNEKLKGKEFSENVVRILDSWGIVYNNKLVVTDRLLADRKMVGVGSSRKIVSDIVKINITKEYINQDNLITKGLSLLSFSSPALSGDYDSDNRETIGLAMTSDKTGVIDARVADANSGFLLEAEEKIDEVQKLAILIKGTARSAFYDNILAGTDIGKKMPDFLPLSLDPSELIIVFDVDFISEANWNYYGDDITPYSLLIPNDNLSFVTKSVDYLMGKEVLLGLDSKNILENSKNLGEKIKEIAVEKHYDEIIKNEQNIVDKAAELRAITAEVSKGFSMDKMKKAENINKEIKELKERTNYIGYVVEAEITSSIMIIVILVSFVIPFILLMILVLFVVFMRKIQKKRALEALNEV